MKPTAPHFPLMIAACLISLTLTGCGSSSGRVDPVVAARVAEIDLPGIPDIPADLRQACPRPALSAGADAKVLTRRYAVALTDCDRRRARAVAWSDGVRRDFGGTKWD